MKSSFLGFGSEEALRHIANGLREGVFTLDTDGRITYWNEAAQRVTGYTAAEAVGSPCSILGCGGGPDACMCKGGPIQCGLALNGQNSKKCAIRTKNGRFLGVVKCAVVIRDAAGEAMGALESFTPVPKMADVPCPSGLAGLVGRHPVMTDLFGVVPLVAVSNATVLVVGESGSGKDCLAGAIHALGPRASGPLVHVPATALEVLLDDGARRAPEPFEDARNGTLVLDEVGDLSPSAQLKLLRLVERRDADRNPDGAEAQHARLICTAQSDLRSMVDERRFRADLFFRLNVVPLRVPPLREHLEDVPLLAEAFLSRRHPPTTITRAASQRLMAHRWPGNVRELHNTLEYAALRAGEDPIAPEHLPQDLGHAMARAAATPEDERAQLAEALARCGGNRTLAARSLGISRVTLWKRMKRHGVLDDIQR